MTDRKFAHDPRRRDPYLNRQSSSITSSTDSLSETPVYVVSPLYIENEGTPEPEQQDVEPFLNAKPFISPEPVEQPDTKSRSQEDTSKLARLIPRTETVFKPVAKILKSTRANDVFRYDCAVMLPDGCQKKQSINPNSLDPYWLARFVLGTEGIGGTVGYNHRFKRPVIDKVRYIGIFELEQKEHYLTLVRYENDFHRLIPLEKMVENMPSLVEDYFKRTIFANIY